MGSRINQHPSLPFYDSSQFLYFSTLTSYFASGLFYIYIFFYNHRYFLRLHRYLIYIATYRLQKSTEIKSCVLLSFIGFPISILTFHYYSDNSIHIFYLFILIIHSNIISRDCPESFFFIYFYYFLYNIFLI